LPLAYLEALAPAHRLPVQPEDVPANYQAVARRRHRRDGERLRLWLATLQEADDPLRGRRVAGAGDQQQGRGAEQRAAE
jgi:hypothetical protein